ncbi:MAG: 50S ribosomal protein L32 [Firmicutes bacterium]|nr:50S ribosomal protein L32 [Bacillota bacterium]
MAVPKTKVSKSRKNMKKAANFRVSATTITGCRNCHAPVRPHCVCLACGYYKGEKRIDVASETK